ncbi:MAG: CHAT domain-containing protein [Candidatus Promineifilaceae bacterium]
MTPNEILDNVVADLPNCEQLLLGAEIRPNLTVEVHIKLTNYVIGLVDTELEAALMLAKANVAASEVTGGDKARIYALWGYAWALSADFAYLESLTIFEEIATFLAQAQEWGQLTGIQINRIWILVNLGRYSEAFALEKAVRHDLMQRVEPRLQYRVNLELNMAQAYENSGQLAAALACTQRGALLADEAQDANVAAKLKIIEGHILTKQDNYAEAERAFAQSLAKLAQTQNETDVGRVNLYLGILNFSQGRYQDGLQHLELARERFTALDWPAEVAYIENQKARIYFALNLLDETLERSVAAAKILADHAMPFYQVEALINQSRVYLRRNNFRSAASILETARLKALQIEAHGLLLTIDILRTQTARQSGLNEDALTIALATLGHVHIESYPTLLTQLHVELACCYLQQEKSAEARHQLQTASALAERYELREITIQTHYLFGCLEDQIPETGQHDRFEQAIALIERQNKSLPLDEFRIGYLSDKQAIYDSFVTMWHRITLAEQRDKNALIAALSRMYTAYLPQKIGGGDRSFVLEQALTPLRARWYAYQARLDGVSFKRDEAVTDIVEPTIQSGALEKIEAEIAELLRQQRLHQTGRLEAEIDEAVTIASLQTQLKSQQAFICFYLAEGQCHALVLRSGEVEHVVSLVSAEMIDQLLQAWRFHIGNSTVVQSKSGLMIARAYLQRLYRCLIRPIDALLDGILELSILTPTLWHDLPFAALFDGARHLVERYAVSRLSSFELGYGNVVRPKSDALVIGYSDEGRLPYALQESAEIAQQLTTTNAVTYLSESDATVGAVRNASTKCTILHFATHARFRPDNPFFSWIKLSDGHFPVIDLYDLHFENRPLIVLSACETGRGVPRGGGIVGFARGFLSAGAGELIINGWQIEDTASSHLMRRFYYYRQLEPNSAVALQRAQIDVLANHPHPFFWSSYIHVR